MAVRPIFFAVLAVASPLNWAQAAEPTFHWFAHENGERVWGLSYAQPRSDVGLLWISCQAATGEVTITPGLRVSAKTEGEKGVITLASPAGKLRLEGEASLSEISGAMEISASLHHPEKLVSLFGRRGSLKIEVPGNKAAIPLDRQAQSAFAEFSRRCFSRLPAP